MKKRVASAVMAAAIMASCLPVMAAAIMASCLPVMAAENAATGTTVYNFGAVDVAGTVTVPADTEYTAGTGYGFLGLNNGYSLDANIDGWTMTQGYDLVLANGAEESVDGAEDTWVSTTVRDVNGVSYQSPIRFAMKSETNSSYKVTVNIRRADAAKEANVDLFTEKRHQHLLDEPVPEEGLSYTTTVHTHNIYRKSGAQIVDTMLNVAAFGENVAITSIEVTPLSLDETKTLWVMGDSTVCEQTAAIPYFPLDHCQGVGSAMAKYLGEDWAIVNEAESGTRAGDSMNHFNHFINDVKPGDVVWFEFGHNDDKVTNDPATNYYLSYLQTYYTRITEKQASLLVVSPIQRMTTGQYSGGVWGASLAQYGPAAKAFVEEKIAGGATNIAYIDLNTHSLEFLNEVHREITATGVDYGSANPAYYYNPGEYTHPNDYGADNFAESAVDEALETIRLANSYCVTADADTDAKLYRAAYSADGILEALTEQDIKLAAGENYIEKVDGTKTFVWSGADTMKPYTLTGADETVKVQAAVLEPIFGSVREGVRANRVAEEIVKAGKAPNSYYPADLVESVKYDTPIILEEITFDENGAPATVSGKWVASDLECVYAYVIVDIYDAEGELKGSVTSADFFDASGDAEQMLSFTAGETVFDSAAGDAFKAYAVAYDEVDFVLTDTVVSTVLDEDSLIDIKETLIEEDFSGYSTTGVILGSNGWNSRGTGEFSLGTEGDLNYAHFVGSGRTWYPYRNFTAVSEGQLMVKFDVRYISGQLLLHLTDGSKAPNDWPPNINPMIISTSNGEVKVSLAGTEVCAINSNEWTTIKLVVDMDYGKYYLTVAGKTYTADATMFQTTGTPSPSKLGAITFIRNKVDGTYDIANLTVASLNTDELPDYTVTLGANDSLMGSVSGAGSYKLNTTATIKATPADGYAFTGWQKADGTVLSEDAEYTFRVREDMKLTATFIKQSGISAIVDYSITSDKNSLKAEAGRTTQLSIADAVDGNGNPVSAVTAADAEWKSNTTGITVSADGLVTVGADYVMDANSASSAEIVCVLNGIEKTFTLTTYSYAYYELMGSGSNYNGRIMNYAGKDAIVFGGSKENFVYTLGDTVALDKATTITYKNAWTGSNTCGQYRTLNFKDTSGNTIFSMYYSWGGLFVGGTELTSAVSKDTWTDVVISIDPTTKVVTVTANGQSATTTLAGTNLASIQFSAANSVPADRLLGMSEIIIEQ